MTLHPKLPLHYVHGVPWCVALGVVDYLRDAGLERAGVFWPHDIDRGDGELLTMTVSGGADEEGMYVTLRVQGEAPGMDVGALDAAVRRRVDAWERAVSEGRCAAGPLASFLSELFDRMTLMGADVDVLYPNGRPFDRGSLAGLDVWGRATVRCADGSELQIAPEQARLRRAR
ncbi:hypothetical protein [Olsenella sp. HMSC062G07]|uniref:hypothetical protein n=1 Tax=Olsenella sp. HMSC062G07 TaxID=1739330 RepID=UPI0008A2F016|nr:hypothetical protein [Olsenella sp. HMSC062G07]OFK25296.1 hypothetical protein HMPREF2826_03110 [Olsenella sp. HMSC062G07]